MSFLKRWLQRRQATGKPVYDQFGHAIGRITTIRSEGASVLCEVQSLDTAVIFSFPLVQFYHQANQYYLLPPWLSTIHAAFTTLQTLKTWFTSLERFQDALPREAYVSQLTELANQGLSSVDEITRHFPQFEEYLITLNQEKTTILAETSHVMSWRLLSSGTEGPDGLSLTKREYSQRIIALRQRFTNVLRLIQFVSTLYANSKTGLRFLEELLETLTQLTQAPFADAARLQTLHQQVAIAEEESKELLTLLDGLMQSFTKE